MKVRLHKTSRDRHLFEVLRDDGSAVRRELETRSCLRHDLMHWALERTAGLDDSFFGRLARGEDPGQDGEQLTMSSDGGGELQTTELLVGMLQGAAARDVDPDAFVRMVGERLELEGGPAPSFLTADLVREVLDRYRKLERQWEFLRHGGVLELDGAFGA